MPAPGAMVLLLYWLCLCCTPLEAIKIGISHNENQTQTTITTSTTTTTAMTTDASGTSTYNLESTSSPLPEVVSTTTTTQTFPPRKLPKKTPTTAVTEAAAPTNPTPPTNGTTKPKTVNPRQNYRYNYCDCDSLDQICEINCCCDRDCSPDALLVFDCLQSVMAPQLETRLENFQYTHGLPTCQIHDGWLCVFRTNTKSSKPQPLENHFDAAQYNKWPEQLGAIETPMAQSSTAYYKFGQALQLWQAERKEVSNFELPMAFESLQCQLKQSVRHLEPVRSNCMVSDVFQLQNQVGELINLTNSHQLLARPRDLLLDQDQDEAGINIEVCQQLLEHPSRIICLDRGNDSQSDFLVDKMELQLLHNFTHILTARLLLWEASVQDDSEPLWLSYVVVYKSFDEVEAKPSSGPLGYVRGAPLLFAVLQPQNKTSARKQTHQLSYFQGNTTMNPWLTLCQRNTEPRHVVGFGVDLTKQCQLRHLGPDLGNLTNYCQQLQARVWNKLLPQNCTRLADLDQIFVSQLGRPQPSKWLPLRLSYADGEQVPPAQGVYNEEQKNIRCRNIFLSVSYEFFVAELTVYQEDHVPHQPVLQHARLVLGQPHDLEFDAGEQQVELPLTASVMFFWPQQKRFNSKNDATILIYPRAALISLTLFMFLKNYN